MVAKFNNTTQPECTFCTLAKNLPAEKETMMHLFYYCPTTMKLYEQWFQKYSTVRVPDPTIFFMSNVSEVEEINRGVQFIFETLMYTIWQSKLEKKFTVQPNLIWKWTIILAQALKYQIKYGS